MILYIAERKEFFKFALIWEDLISVQKLNTYSRHKFDQFKYTNC